jgi:Ca2+-binding EF-hand superfamily protein
VTWQVSFQEYVQMMLGIKLPKEVQKQTLTIDDLKRRFTDCALTNEDFLLQDELTTLCEGYGRTLPPDVLRSRERFSFQDAVEIVVDDMNSPLVKIDSLNLLKHVFDRYDQNNSGSLNVECCTDALAHYLEATGLLDDSRIVPMAREVAVEDTDGQVHFEEFIDMTELVLDKAKKGGFLQVSLDDMKRRFDEAIFGTNSKHLEGKDAQEFLEQFGIKKQVNRLTFSAAVECVVPDPAHPVRQVCSTGDMDLLRDCFNQCDENNSGDISRDELRSVLSSYCQGKKIPDSFLDERMKEADGNDDGVVTFEEYVAMATGIKV